MMDAPLLVGDVGGTNVRLALAERRGGAWRIEGFHVFPGKDFTTFEDVLRTYLDETGVRPARACFAIAGPVQHGQGRLTNRGWLVSDQAVAARFGISDVLVVNDFLAMARSVPELGADAFETVLPGTPVAAAPMIVTGPGTGFGVATLLASGRTWTVLSGEGGHTRYAPQTDIEHELARLLARGRGYVSNERVASGSGLDEVHAAFCEMFGRAKETLTPAEMRIRADGGDPMYRALIELRALAVMGYAGDLALINGALGGVVLAGGVVERIADFLKTPAAVDRFVSRGPMSDYLKACPVSLMHEPSAPLLGAAAHFEQSRI